MQRLSLRLIGLSASAALCISAILVLSQQFKKSSPSGTDSAPKAPERSSRTYYVRGVWSDACPCPIPCPCWHSGLAAVSQCVNIHVFFVDEARFGNTTLPQFFFVLVNLPNAPGFAPSPHALYVGEEVSDNAVDLITSFIRDAYSNAALLRTVRVKIDAETSAEHQQVQIPGTLDYRIRLPANMTSSRPAPVVESHLYPWLQNARQGVTEQVIYRDGEQAFTYAGRNALFASFEFSGNR